MTVIDASAVVSLILGEQPQAFRVNERLERASSLHTVHLLDIEVLSALRRLVHRGELTESEAHDAIQFWERLSVTRYPHAALRERIWTLRDNLTPYDVSYVALAETLDAPLVTTDGRLARAPGHSARVEYIT